MHITQTPFLEDLCMLLIFRDAHLENLKVELLRLYDPCVAKVYVCVSKKLNFLTRAKALREIRNVFAEADIFINNVTDTQLKLVAFYSHFYTQTGRRRRGFSPTPNSVACPKHATYAPSVRSDLCESTNAPSSSKSSKAGRSDAPFKTMRTTKSTPISAETCADTGSSSVQATQ